MKPLTVLMMLFALTSCGDDVTPPARNGEVVVYIYWDNAGLSEKQVEIVETGDSLTTDEYGLARFVLAPGQYTVRAYDINRGGPCCGYVDEPVTVMSGETTRIEIFDCITCDAPARIPGGR